MITGIPTADKYLDRFPESISVRLFWSLTDEDQDRIVGLMSMALETGNPISDNDLSTIPEGADY